MLHVALRKESRYTPLNYAIQRQKARRHVNNELGRIYNEALAARLEVLPPVFIQELRRATKYLLE
jgi:hypothetical protein